MRQITFPRTVAWAHGLALTYRGAYVHCARYGLWQRNFSQHILHASATSGNQNNKPDEYELRVGHAIATLQDDLPKFFPQGLTEPMIYSPHIVLSDPHYTRLSVHGRTVYLGIAQMLRWSLRLYFDDIHFEIVRMRVLPDQSGTDSKRDLEGIKSSSQKPTVRHLEVKWRLKGTRRPGLFLSPPFRHVEGVFVYTFDSEGYIGEHRIQRIVPPPSRRVLWLHSLGGRMRAYWEATKQRREPALTPELG